MATADAGSLGSSQYYSPQEVLQEVRKFLVGASCKVQNQRQRDSLAQSALFLLRTLPTARHAVLEYLANSFDEAVNNYLLEMDIGHGMADTSCPVTDSLLHDACGVLHTFIQTNSAAWAPIISTWSLELLGHISSKYSGRRGVPHTGSLNELLQLWLTCKPTKLLIEVATECFAQMVGGTPENCVDALLEASVKYSPHFDWVVAHIGSSFPRTIITRVLMCGLKDYCQHGSHGDGDSNTKIPKMGSVVGILGHLASKHSHDIRDALMNLFQESLDEKEVQPRVTTIPFLLQLASMSPLLLHILTTDLVKALTAPVLNRLHTQFQLWVKSYPHAVESMMTLVVHLVMQTDTGADKALDFLLYNATANMDNTPPDTPLPLPEIQTICRALIDQILTETQMMVLRCGRAELNLDLPYLDALSSRLPQLTRDMLSDDGRKSKWLQRLICYIILYKGERLGAETLAHILAHASNHQQLWQVVYIQQQVEVGMAGVLPACVQLAMDMLQQAPPGDQRRLLHNLHTLTQWEATNKHTSVRKTFRQSLQKHWEGLSVLVLHEEVQVAWLALRLLNHVTIPDSVSTGAMLRLSGAVISLFFRVMPLQDTKMVTKMVGACKQCSRQLAKRTFVQAILIRYLLEGAIEHENRPLLGGREALRTATTGSRDSHTELMAENKNHGLSLTTLRSHSSVFHAGVIGQGLRDASRSAVLPEEQISRNCTYLEEMLWTCCQDQTVPQTDAQTDSEDQSKPPKSYKLRVSPDMCRSIGNQVVEMATPDVLYNNRFWPEEESLKMTVERDLHVWKVFEENPVVWRVMELLAGNSLIMSRCSPVLKSLTAAMMHHFESSREKKASDSPQQLNCVCFIVRCLGKSGLLPSPLGMLSELFPFVTPYEVFLLLLTIWRYMKETPPTEDPGEVFRRVCEPRHLEVIRIILHKNISTTGHMYSRFFPSHGASSAVVKTEQMDE